MGMINSPTQKKHCGFIAIIGRPNVGKSTLMNHLIGQKISITSRKPQTTQHKINGVLSMPDCQYIFTDTPGFQTLHLNQLNTLLNKSVVNALNNVDIIIFVVEALSFNQGDINVLELLPPNACVFLVVNKQDKIKDKPTLNAYLDEIKGKYNFAGTVFVSAKHHTGIEELLEQIKPHMPEGEFLYPADQLTDKNSRFLASEIIREKLFRHLGQELPYNLAVEIEEYDEQEKLIKISALIIVDKTNQKGIVIGKNGEKLKKISSEARADMEQLLNQKVFLQVWVKVRSGFADEAKFLKSFE